MLEDEHITHDFHWCNMCGISHDWIIFFVRIDVDRTSHTILYTWIVNNIIVTAALKTNMCGWSRDLKWVENFNHMCCAKLPHGLLFDECSMLTFLLHATCWLRNSNLGHIAKRSKFHATSLLTHNSATLDIDNISHYEDCSPFKCANVVWCRARDIRERSPMAMSPCWACISRGGARALPPIARSGRWLLLPLVL
jgi:hypothetical protein